MESSVAILFINHTAKIRYFVHDRISFSYLLQSLIFNKIEQEEVSRDVFVLSKRYPNPLDRTTEKSYDIRNNVRESERNERKIEAEKRRESGERGKKFGEKIEGGPGA